MDTTGGGITAIGGHVFDRAQRAFELVDGAVVSAVAVEQFVVAIAGIVVAVNSGGPNVGTGNTIFGGGVNAFEGFEAFNEDAETFALLDHALTDFDRIGFDRVAEFRRADLSIFVGIYFVFDIAIDL